MTKEYFSITSNEIDNIKIGVYKNAAATKRSDIIRLRDYLVSLQDYCKDDVLKLRQINDEREQKEYKKNNLIGVTISALFGEDSRTTDNVIQYNNLMCIDVDEEDNKSLFSQYDIEYIKQKIFELNFVYCVSLSCRGKGFYFIVPIPSSRYINEYYTSMYYHLQKFGINIDKHCKDISRLRFISYDENILIKRDCEIEVFDRISEEQIDEKRRECANASKRISRMKFNSRNKQMNDLYHAIDILISKGFDTGEHWDRWATIGTYLKTIGDEGRILFHKLSEVSSGYKGYNDVEKNWKRFKQCNSEDEAFGKFFGMMRNIYGANWRNEM